MAKWANDDVMDMALAEVAKANTLLVTSSQPADRVAALTAALADVVVTPGNGNGDFVIANRDTNGRKVTVLAQVAFTVDTTGTATHICLIDTTRLLYVTTRTSQPLNAGGKLTIPAWKIEISAPS